MLAGLHAFKGLRDLHTEPCPSCICLEHCPGNGTYSLARARIQSTRGSRRHLPSVPISNPLSEQPETPVSDHPRIRKVPFGRGYHSPPHTGQAAQGCRCRLSFAPIPLNGLRAPRVAPERTKAPDRLLSSVLCRRM